VKLSRVVLAMVVSAVGALSLCSNAGAANVTVGPSLTQSFEIATCGEPCALLNLADTQPGARVLTPAGAIVRWSVVDGTTPGEYHLRVANRLGNATFQFVTTSPSVQSAGTPGIQTFNLATPIPVSQGQAIALEMSEAASVGVLEEFGDFTGWFPPVPDGATAQGELFPPEEGIVGFNAEIQPAPTVASLGTTSGPTAGGTSVTINGADLENATSVSFGSTPAASYTVNSENQITAVAPASGSAAAVSVKVATIAGEATASQQFGYVAPPPPPVVVSPAPKKTQPKPVKQCVVPNLKGKKLPAAKAALKKGDCKAGKVTKLKGATPKTGKVAAQSRKAGAKAVAGAKVNLTLKP
jgi:PASTA domain/IPT/TIG domain